MVINIQNYTSSSVDAQAGTDANGGVTVDVIVADLNNGGPISSGITSNFNVKRKPRGRADANYRLSRLAAAGAEGQQKHDSRYGFQGRSASGRPAIFENQTDDLKVTWSLTWIFTLAQERAFQQWLRSPNYLNRGLNWFRMNINLGGSGLQLQELHFTQMPVQTSIDGGVVTGREPLLRTTSTMPTTNLTTSLLNCRRRGIPGWISLSLAIRTDAILNHYRGCRNAELQGV